MRMRARIPQSAFLIVNFTVCIAAVAASATQSLPDSPGKDVFESVCSLCHAATTPFGKQWTRPQWEAKVTEMLQEEPDVTAQERAAIVEYLAANFRPGGKIYVNYGKAKELETALELSTKDAEVMVRYRDQNGPFKTVDDVKKVPGLEATKVDVRKDRFIF